jgi:hypothetical protein
VPIEGFPDPTKHRLCIRCHKWHLLHEGVMQYPERSGPVGRLRSAASEWAGDESAKRFICHGCLRKRRRTNTIIWATFALLLLVTLAIHAFRPKESPTAPTLQTPQLHFDPRPAPISREDVDGIFAQLREEEIDPESELVWSFSFSDASEAKLEAAATQLEAMGYRKAKIIEHPDAGGLSWLHMERTERHTPESLHQRNCELYRLAAELGLRSYEGAEARRAGSSKDLF